MRFLEELVRQVWESATVLEEWCQGIIVSIYKGKGSRSECKNYRVITLLSVPGKVFMHHACDTLSYHTNPPGL